MNVQTYKKALLASLFAIASFILADYLCGQSVTKEDFFDRTVQTFTLSGQTAFEAIAMLHQTTGIVVSVERIQGSEDLTQSDQQFTTTITGGKPNAILDEICALDHRYVWSRDGKMVNIYPRASVGQPSYLFNRKIQSFQLEKVPDAATAAIRAVRESTGAPAQLIILQAGNYDFAQPWTIEFDSVTLRQAINRIAEHLCDTCGWQVNGEKSNPTVIFYRNLQTTP